MDFIHEDPQAEREYIKRLMKHRQEHSIICLNSVEHHHE
jgi:hypothetical protein